MIDPATGKLTTEAEKVVKTPGVLSEVIQKAGKWGGVSESSGAARVLTLGRVIPAVAGSWLAFNAGEGIGEEVCGLFGLSWCMKEEATEANPAPGTEEGVWTAYETSCGSGSPAFAWYWKRNGSSNRCEVIYKTLGGNHESCGFKPPAGGIFWANPAWANQECGTGPEAGLYKFSRGAVYWWPTQNRAFSTNASDDPLTPNRAFTVGPEWQKDLAGAMKETPEGGRVGQQIAHEISPGGVASPYANYVNIPSCDEVTWGACKAALEGKELVPVRESIDWDEVVTDVPAEVLTLTPPAGNNVETGSAVTVTTNPDEAGMPVIIPEPEPHETYEHYAARLNPALHPGRSTVSDVNEDAEAGPNAVLQVDPEPGTKADPGTTTDVNVRTNPSDAPPAGSGGGSCGGGIGAVDWSPLNQPLGSKFPFGIFGFFVSWIGEWEASEGVAPTWSVTFLPSGVFGSKGLSTGIDLGFMTPVVEEVRPLFLFASFVGLLWFLGTAAAKLQGDNS